MIPRAELFLTTAQQTNLQNMTCCESRTGDHALQNLIQSAGVHVKMRPLRKHTVSTVFVQRAQNNTTCDSCQAIISSDNYLIVSIITGIG